MSFPNGFLWGASTAPHQIEGNNLNSDFWANEGRMPGMERSGDACDSYHRYREDMRLLADNGFNSYRFGIEWARIEPVPGEFSRAELGHYRLMIETALELGLKAVVTLHHFTNPAWFAAEGGWAAPPAIDRFRAYVETATSILDGVEWVVTMNEPNMLAMMTGLALKMQQATEAGVEWQSPTVDDGPRPPLPAPEPEIGKRFVEAHHAVRDLVRERTGAKVGWSVANRAFEARPGCEAKMQELQYIWEDLYLEGSKGDDFVGVQSYSAQWVGEDGIEPYPPHPDNTLVGTAFRPDAIGIAVRHTHEVTGLPILITENGIATSDDTRRIAYTEGALQALHAAVNDGVDLRGYLHWSLLDNYEWGHWAPTFGLVQVDRTTFVRTPKPSLAWLGGIARANGAEIA
ncbi:family 1 glycosylhydrolase [Glycomyces sp. NPDC048151]|uniref:family 1 glycosylhydrolase n=1 Tax=Glycomyces sp. NPDC048151 TaxID=3364002 RepID=UPI00371CFD2C